MRRVAWVVALALAWGAARAETQLAAGNPVAAGETVGVAFHLYSTDGITAGQFDLPVPAGWTLSRVEADPRFLVSHNLDAGVLGGGMLRVVFYSLTNAPLTGGTLGRVMLRPPDGAPPLPPAVFFNPLFADARGAAFGLSSGFPALRILAHPQSVAVLAGQRAQLSVAVVGIDPVYQWYRGERGDTTVPVGAGGGVLITPELSETARFWVRVSDSFGAVLDSEAATVTVTGVAPLTLNPNFAEVPATSGSGTFMVETLPGAPWTATTTSGWVTLSGASGSGHGTVTYRYLANPGLTLRTAVITVGDAQFTLTQRAAVSPFAGIAPVQGNAQGWKQVPGLGWLSDRSFPYVYQRDQGWLYFHQDGPGTLFHVYSFGGDFGWLRTGAAWADADGNWLYAYGLNTFLYFLPTATPAERTFYHPVEARWIRFP